MPLPLALFLALLLGLVLGVAVGALVARTRAAEATARLSSDLAAARAVADASRERLEGQDDQYRRQIAQQEDRLREFQDRLRDVRIAEAERARTDGQVLVALSPVAESLQAVQQKVAELEAERTLQYGALSEQLRTAAESGERLRGTAESLASALKSNSTRGVWGETQLRNVVQAAGLVERVDFDVQTSISSDAGSGRPDMVVHLPGGKNIAVDAKVPFSAYLEASAIPASATGDEGARRDQLVRQHVKALRAHVDALAGKTYWAGLESSPELVIAFIPSESLVSSALEADPALMDYAFQKRVALASPVTLWSVLKTVAFSWQQDVVTAEAKELFDLSRELYGRLSTMAGHVDKLGRSLRAGVTDYNRFVGSLERTVLPSARRLSMLDESKVLATPTIVEESPRELTAPELASALVEGSTDHD
ncbi:MULTISPECIES: DNA recombination protein RmuC [unclassified Frigoribacterium]|jgi:DNA recombination protein RmuC|uniref:DNA recombination protein RmuC n=1 Tax=unclassified Frigoribacterium TaxID=2627005 RepID=UPI001564E866|nr:MULTISPECIES: DNA recombination protein RmuC [unclassified Frigoribacterium]NQW88322.1 DNA recombination protein RmuC [Frigoribacterium sp. VKM Ac-2860]NQX08869.1 DNA recombination protein RmuC [Frigoribacterium sp. VKM Ac-2859]